VERTMMRVLRDVVKQGRRVHPAAQQDNGRRYDSGQVHGQYLWGAFQRQEAWYENTVRAVNPGPERRIGMHSHGDAGHTKAHHRQVLNYLPLTGTRLGCLLNFGEALMRDGISRIINGDVE